MHKLLDLKYILRYNIEPARAIIGKYNKKILKYEDLPEGINTILYQYKIVLDKKNSLKTSSGKIRCIELFLRWIRDSKNIDIGNLNKINRKVWLEYVLWKMDEGNCTDKTKRSHLLAVWQFFEWLKAKKKFIDIDINATTEDFKKLDSKSRKNNSLAFSKASDVRKILKCL